MKSFTLILVLLLFNFTESIAKEHDPTLDSGKGVLKLLSSLKDSYNKILDLYIEFTQETYHGKINEPMISKGKAYIKRPDKLRWEYITPEKQLILTQGDNIYIYEEEVNQIVVYKKDSFLSKEIQNIFFLKADDILKKYDAQESDLQDKDFTPSLTIKLTPKEDLKDQSSFKAIYFLVSDDFIKGITVIDKLDTKTKIVFTKISINKGIEEKKFSFTPPKDVKIFYYD